MKKTVFILSLLALLLTGRVAALWLLPFTAHNDCTRENRYGINEGLELVEQIDANNGTRYVVEDGDGKMLFAIPLRGCLLDTRYRNDQLKFREQATGREGYIDRQGMVVFTAGYADMPEEKRQEIIDESIEQKSAPEEQQAVTTKTGKTIESVDLKQMAQSNPFYKEASKIMQGKLEEDDAKRRHQILNYCEHFRTAYTTKDIDFLRQVFSDKALIIVGNVVKTATIDDKCQADERITYAIHSKQDYIARLSKVFASNKNIDVKFSGFRIMRHPTMDGIYGVSMRQQYKSDRYSDDGYIFLLWDFRDKSLPLIHVRTWQPSKGIGEGNEIISLQDFNLQ